MGLPQDSRTFELARLRHLDRQHRRISEEAEAEVRQIREQLHTYSKRLQEAHNQLRYHYEHHSTENVIAADWAACDELARKLSRL